MASVYSAADAGRRVFQSPTSGKTALGRPCPFTQIKLSAVKDSTFNWDRVVDELAVMPRRREIARREGYAALVKLSFDDVPAADEWLALENEALRLVEEKCR